MTNLERAIAESRPFKDGSRTVTHQLTAGAVFPFLAAHLQPNGEITVYLQGTGEKAMFARLADWRDVAGLDWTAR